jgi:ADP-heptose:LPS heptosyltransferase
LLEGIAMNVTAMRRIDRWLGMPVCFFLTCWRCCFGRKMPQGSDKPQRILFIKLAEQGSTVLAQEAIQAAVARVGRGNVYFLLFAENRPILDLLDLIPQENIIAIHARGLVRTLVSAVKAFWRLRRARVDAAIDLEFFARSSAALAYLSGARQRVGYHAFAGEASYRGNLMTHRLSFNPYLHTSQAFRVMVEALDYPADRFPQFDLAPTTPPAGDACFVPRPQELAAVRSLLRHASPRMSDAPLMLLNANASDLMPLRRWPSERYVELARRLLRRYPEIVVAFTGAAAEAEAVQRLVSEVDSSRCISVAGKTTLRELLALYCLAEVLVTNDSGPAHFATLTPVDVVVLFGPETPLLFAARSPRTHALWAGLACSPCIHAFNDRQSACRDNICMQRISVDQVFAEVCRLYETRRATAPRRVSA